MRYCVVSYFWVMENFQGGFLWIIIHSYGSEADLLFGGLFFAIIIAAIIFGIICYIIYAVVLYKTAKTNGYESIAIIAWIPIVQIYVLYALGSKKESIDEAKSEALKMCLIMLGLIIVSMIPFIGILGNLGILALSLYYNYRLFFRWTADNGTSIIFVVLSLITGSIFFYIYGLIKMNKPFQAS